MELEKRLLYSPEKIYLEENNGLYLLLDPESPNWISTNEVGADIIRRCDGRKTLQEVALEVSNKWKVGTGKVIKDATPFISMSIKKGFLSLYPDIKPSYRGRGSIIAPSILEELWFYTNGDCNLNCAHCLVEGGPQVQKKGLPLSRIKGLIDEALDLGLKRIYLTGGEPFLRPDIFELIDYVSKRTQTVILTNGTLMNKAFRKISALRDRNILFQVSLEGPLSEINDRIRGMGNFQQTVSAIKGLIKAGINPIVTTTATRLNQDYIVETNRFLATLGVKNHHILWLHPRGRTGNDFNNLFVPPESLTQIMKDLRKVSKETGTVVDNEVSLTTRLRGKRGRKKDLCNCCYDMFSIDADGHVYPCAALTGDQRFDCGIAERDSLKQIWLNSPVMNFIRDLSVQKKGGCNNCHLKFLCGGGCFCQGFYNLEVKEGEGCMMAEDPYCDIYKNLFSDILWELVQEGINGNRPQTGRYLLPVIYNAMEGTLSSCTTTGVKVKDSAFEVEGYHCSCVLAVEGSPFASCATALDPVRESVKDFYSEAVKEPKKELCCPTKYNTSDISHIPSDIIDISYGCGSPVSLAGVNPGETVVDLGSGGGIDCFIAAKLVGPRGRVVGIDMTEEMLNKARTSAEKVAQKLGYSVVEFEKGFLEDVPLVDEVADLVTSNCVINLSPDKERVFKEVHRVLKSGGRFCISDIVADGEVPPYIKTDKRLWGECIAGALSEEEFFNILERTGFYGLQVLSKVLYRTIDNLKFFSLTLMSYRFKKGKGCQYIGQYAIYQGPFKSIRDDDSHEFPRGVAVEVCTDTAEKLKRPPYSGLFVVTDPTKKKGDTCGPGCC